MAKPSNRRTATLAKSRHSETALGIAVIGGLFVCSVPAMAADDEQPDMEFLEYLGSWEESDEDWLVLSDAVQELASEQERTDPAPDGDESVEQQNES